MKKTYLLTGFLASLLFFNCSKDDSDGSDGNNDTDVTQNETEEAFIDVSTLEDGISIDGATLQTGTLTPNEQTSFSVSDSEQSGFKDVGFEIDLDVPTDYAGAYLQLLDEDGVASSSYFDIPAYTYASKSISSKSKASIFSKRKSSPSISAKSLEDEDTVTIEVDFDDTVPAGSFCYFLCIYDQDGNISAPVTLCVEVEEWGGNDNLAGNWTLTKISYTEYGDSYTVNIGEEDCYNDDYIQYCYDDNGEIINQTTVKECDTETSLTLNINSDGTQSFQNIYEYSNFDYEAFADNCTVKYDTIKTDYISSGNWAYDEEEEKLTLVEYNFTETETLDGQPYDDGYNDDYDDEIGVAFDINVKTVTSSELVLEFRDTDIAYDYDPDTGETTTTEYEYVATYYFTK